MKHQGNITINIQSMGQDVSEMLCKLVKQQEAPDVDFDVFDGNPLEYHYFMTLFHEVLEKRVDDPSGKLTRLITYNKGDANEMIKYHAQQPPAQGFKNAKALLERKIVIHII